MLEWINGRWHCGGYGVHAGDLMEMRCPDGTWLSVRIESQDVGRRLYACFDFHGLDLAVSVFDLDGCERVSLRWPIRSGRRYQPAAQTV